MFSLSFNILSLNALANGTLAVTDQLNMSMMWAGPSPLEPP